MSWLDGLAALVNARVGGGANRRANGQSALARAEIAEWLDAQTGDDYPHGLGQAVKRFHRLVDDEVKNRHDAMVDVATLACKESGAGGYPGRRVEDELRAEWLEAIDGDTGHTEAEFYEILAWAIDRAEADDHDERWQIMLREYGSHHSDEINTAPDLDEFAFSLNGQRSANNSGANAKTQEQDEKQDEDRRNQPLDLRRLRTEPRKPIQWFEVGLLPRGGYISLASEAGYGKSVLGRAIAVDTSLGHSHLDPSHTFEPAKVIYLDFENGEDWWIDGLEAMNAPLDVPNLSVMCYPDIGALDTRQGAKKFLKLVSDLANDLDGLDILTIDTVSRVIVGNENDADTWSKFYQYSMLPLRRYGIAINRMDHLGKDPDRGPRGSSHKLSDVDADFRLTAAVKGSDDLTLTLGKRRRQHYTQSMGVKRLDGPLRHEPVLQLLDMRLRNKDGTVKPLSPDVAALVANLDSFGVSITLGRAKAQADYKQRGGALVARNEVWSAAIKFRRETAKTNGTNGQQTSAQNGQQT